MVETQLLNICQPGNSASCALCCGSHNFKASHSEITALFIERTEQFNRRKKIFLDRCFDEQNRQNRELLFRECITSSPFGEITLPKLYRDGIQCPFIGYIDHKNEVLGCLLYPNTDQPDLRTYTYQTTCHHFSCVAKEILTDDEISFASELMKDWFYYSLFIHGISLLKDMHRQFENAENVPTVTLHAIQEALRMKLYKVSSYRTQE